MVFSTKALRKEWVTTKGLVPEDFLVLILFVLGIEKTQFFQSEDTLLTEEQHKKLTGLFERRLLKEPVAYLTGNKEFFGRTFKVNKDTLIPRPDSECLVEDILSFGKNTRIPEYVFDIGTGSGALIVTLARELAKTTTKYIASDISEGALVIAKQNSENLNAPVTFLQGSLLEPYQSILEKEVANQVFIIANLPYVSETLFKTTEPDVQSYEPTSALISDDEGMAHYKKLFEEIKKHDALSGWCWIEISPEQSDTLLKVIKSAFPDSQAYVGQDLSQRDRFIRFHF